MSLTPSSASSAEMAPTISERSSIYRTSVRHVTLLIRIPLTVRRSWKSDSAPAIATGENPTKCSSCFRPILNTIQSPFLIIPSILRCLSSSASCRAATASALSDCRTWYFCSITRSRFSRRRATRAWRSSRSSSERVFAGDFSPPSGSEKRRRPPEAQAPPVRPPGSGRCRPRQQHHHDKNTIIISRPAPPPAIPPIAAGVKNVVDESDVEDSGIADFGIFDVGVGVKNWVLEVEIDDVTGKGVMVAERGREVVSGVRKVVSGIRVVSGISVVVSGVGKVVSGIKVIAVLGLISMKWSANPDPLSPWPNESQALGAHGRTSISDMQPNMAGRHMAFHGSRE